MGSPKIFIDDVVNAAGDNLSTIFATKQDNGGGTTLSTLINGVNSSSAAGLNDNAIYGFTITNGTGIRNCYYGGNMSTTGLNLGDNVCIAWNPVINDANFTRSVLVGNNGDVTLLDSQGTEVTGVGYNTRLGGWRATANGAWSWALSISATANGWGSRAVMRHCIALGRGAVSWTENGCVFGSNSNYDYWFANGDGHRWLTHWSNAETGHNTGVSAQNDPDDPLSEVRLHAIDAFDHEFAANGGTASLKNGGHIAICGGAHNHNAGVGGHVRFKIALPGQGLGDNVRAAKTIQGYFDDNTAAGKSGLVLRDGDGTNYRVIFGASNQLEYEAA